jgi:hypothetical protein
MLVEVVFLIQGGKNPSPETLNCVEMRFDDAGGASLFELDRLLKPGGIFVHVPVAGGQPLDHQPNSLCWAALPEASVGGGRTSIWRKASNHSCNPRSIYLLLIYLYALRLIWGFLLGERRHIL